MHKTCEICGATLDFGEKCTCNKDDLVVIVTRALGAVSFEELTVAIGHAVHKQRRILEREGDENGQRREPSYLAQLVIEQIVEKRKIAQLNKSAKRSSSEMSYPV